MVLFKLLSLIFHTRGAGHARWRNHTKLIERNYEKKLHHYCVLLLTSSPFFTKVIV